MLMIPADLQMEAAMPEPTRLERLLFRLEAQHRCLGWAFREIGNRPGIVFEMGLGHGRTYDHLRSYLPGRDIYVFDREVDCFADCTPPADRLLLGDIGDRLAAAAARFAGQVVLAHSDLGSYGEAHNTAMSALVSRLLPPALAPGAIVLSDLPLDLAGAQSLPLPAGTREDRYFVYRNGAA
ncbi:hypothetical protein C7I84_12650 [Mesorhizobium ephedrae]|uniref:Methyltransferase n=2 Tax=Kumtagia ephedrae TaxID=2116701 RepID=A0A2P7SCC1_9HYPH|nr:hypothetical protein C7I84_12650 [Mesorhizobium ephedrae]